MRNCGGAIAKAGTDSVPVVQQARNRANAGYFAPRSWRGDPAVTVRWRLDPFGQCQGDDLCQARGIHDARQAADFSGGLVDEHDDLFCGRQFHSDPAIAEDEPVRAVVALINDFQLIGLRKSLLQERLDLRLQVPEFRSSPRGSFEWAVLHGTLEAGKCGDGCSPGGPLTPNGVVLVDTTKTAWVFTAIAGGRKITRLWMRRPGWMSRRAVVRAAVRFAAEIAANTSGIAPGARVDASSTQNASGREIARTGRKKRPSGLCATRVAERR